MYLRTGTSNISFYIGSYRRGRAWCRPTREEAAAYVDSADYSANLQSSLLTQARATPQFAAALQCGALCMLAVRGHLLEVAVVLGSESALRVRPAPRCCACVAVAARVIQYVACAP